MSAGEVVAELEKRVNTGDVDGVMELFSSDPLVTIPALGPRQGRNAVRALFDFCAGIEVRWHIREVAEREGGADCMVDQFDGWASLMGLAPLQYERFQLWLDDGLISRIEGTWSEDTLAALGAALEDFTPWAVQHHPELYGPDGDFHFTRSAGEGFIAAAREWMAS